MRLFPASFLLLSLASALFPQSAINPRGGGNRTIVISPMAGSGTALDPYAPHVLKTGIDRAKMEGISARWVPSDDGRMAIVELRSTRAARLTQALDSAVGLAGRFDLGVAPKADLETELRRIRKNFSWSDLAGLPVDIPVAGKTATAKTGDSREAASERAAYSYYYTDAFSTIDLAHWNKNGDLAGSANGLKASTVNGGAVISKDAVPDGSSNYEISSNLKITGAGAIFSHFVRATSNAKFGGGAAGTYWMVDFEITSFVPSVSCQARLRFYRVDNGTVYGPSIDLPNVGCFDGMELRTIMHPVEGIHVFAGDSWLAGTADAASSPAGSPGVGVRGSTTNGSITAARLGLRDSQPPSITPLSNIVAVGFPNTIDIQWRGSADTGRGFWKYDIMRRLPSDQYWQYKTGVLDPVYTDTTVAPATEYCYLIWAWDLHMNRSEITFNVTTPPAGSTRDQRQTGVRPLGSYYGASGENIDLQSGNLNFTLPLLSAVGRGRSSLALGLSYNSQNWRSDGTSEWMFIKESGYGIGWTLQLGSITPFYSDWTTVHHYTFTDASGAEYRLNNVAGTQKWTTKDGVYLTYDAATNKLWFNDGTFWLMDAESAGEERDAGARFPTLIQDSNGNQSLLSYDTGVLAAEGNTSGRIKTVTDARAAEGQATYTFAYTDFANEKRRLTSIVNSIGAGGQIQLTYSSVYGDVKSPFTGIKRGEGRTLDSLVVNGQTWTFTYDANGAGELTNVFTPLQGQIGWNYADFQYVSGRKFREVANRWVIPVSGQPGIGYTFSTDTGDGSRQAHASRKLFDSAAAWEKEWFFESSTASAFVGLQNKFEERTLPASTILYRQEFTWSTLGSSGQPYVSQTTTKLDPGQSYQAEQITTQSIDAYGNVTGQTVNDFTGSSRPSRIYTMTYETGASYLNAYLRALLKTAVITDGTLTRTMVTHVYDYSTGTCNPGYVPAPSGIRLWTAPPGPRGNATATTPLGQPMTCRSLDGAGNLISATTGAGTQSLSYTSDTNFTLPSVITPNNNSQLAVSRTYNTFLGLTHIDAPNSVSMDFTWNAQAQPASSQSPHGAVNSITYSGAGNSIVTQTVNGKVTETSSDGFGRVVRVRTGLMVSGSPAFDTAVDTEYAACACSPLGKMKRVSMPYAWPGSPSQWTTHEFDARGRTLKVTPPGNAGFTSYVYQGSTVKVIEPNTDRWKLFTMDGFGNLVQVDEPNPGGGANFVTTYSYNLLNQLKTAAMTRGSVTQNRAWNYDSVHRLTSYTLPETGTTTLTYDANSRLATRTDAKSQRLEYSYDNYNRVTEIRQGPAGSTVPFRRMVYDNGADNGMGRVTRIEYGPFDAVLDLPKLKESYIYTPGGLVTAKTLSLQTNGSNYTSITGNFAYDTQGEGRRKSVTYPRGWSDASGAWVQDAALAYELSFDGHGRPSGLTEKKSGFSDIVAASGISYNLANQMTAATIYGIARTWSFNSRGQLTNESAGTVMNFTYGFSATANDGRVEQRTDTVSGETVSYLYDKLGRLTSATATGSGGAWNQSFVYDGFGNMTQRSGSGTPMSVTVNSKNQITSGGATYDLNGNLQAINGHGLTYDFENRLTSVSNVALDDPGYYGYGFEQYGYSVRGERLLVEHVAIGTSVPHYRELRFYDLGGQLLSAYTLTPSCAAPCTPTYYPVEKTDKRRVYFAGRLVKVGTKSAVTDRLGSLVALSEAGVSTRYRYYPYGEAIGTQEWDKPQFATYTRDGSSGLDDAMNRQFDRIWGRFTSPDPYQASGGPADPGSWNRYGYVGGDPINYLDRRGLLSEPSSVCGIDASSPLCAVDDPTIAAGLGEQWPQTNGGGTGEVLDQGGLFSAVQRAIAALEDTRCSSLFNGPTNPTSVLQTLLDGTGGEKYGAFVWENLGGPSPTGRVASAVTRGILLGDPSKPSQFVGANIVINSNVAAPWLGGYPDTFRLVPPGAPLGPVQIVYRAMTIIHELGHWYMFVYGGNSTAIVDDQSDANASQQNTQRVFSACFQWSFAGGHP